MKSIHLFLCFCLMLVSCESYDLSRKGFSPITENLLYDSITPAFQHDYLEIREFPCWDSTYLWVRHSEGSYPFADSLFCSAGINFSNANFCLFSNVLSIDGTAVKFWTTYDDIVYFLAPIDCAGDALLLAHLKGYFFRYGDENYGIKEQDGKFYLKAFKMVLLCDPIQTDQFFLEVDEAGKIKILDRKAFNVMKGACI